MGKSRRKWSTVAACTLATSNLWLLAHCGGTNETKLDVEDGATRDSSVAIDAAGDSETAPDTTSVTDAAPGGGDEFDATLDATTPDAAEGGADATVDAPTDAPTDAPSDAPTDAPSDAPTDAPTDAAPEAAPPAACDLQTPCADAAGVACCNGFCVDTSRDPTNCGQCGRSCPSAQFCDGIGCADAILSNLCDNPRGTVVFDPYAVDNEAGIAMGGALSSYCLNVPTIVQVDQHAGGVIDPATGRPITGVGNTFIAGGGAFGQNGTAYIELQSQISPLYLNSDGTVAQIVIRATGTNAVDTLDSTLTAHHDFFYIQLAVEPQSGTLCFSAAGINGPGTQAAGYYVSAVIAPALSTFTKTWYVVEWTDTNGDSIANNGDTFDPVASGP